MATIVLGTVGALVGGPIGGALGAFAGSKLDGDLFGSPGNEGPRLDELSITTSSYGRPIARHFGKVRAAGTIIWATDLNEHKRTSGGKGKPRTTTYSYSVSFAVALASRPIDRIGRVWADGNLLRGADGDLKVAGSLRLHLGHGDQPVDPLLQSAQAEPPSPAYRGLSYAVLEDLDLSEYGNRIPALTFEIEAGEGAETIQGLVEILDGKVKSSSAMSGLSGYTHEEGSIGQSLSLMAMLEPQQPRDADETLLVEPFDVSASPKPLPEPAAWNEGEFGARTGQQFEKASVTDAVSSLRYYDVDRDYQPGLQRTVGTGGAASGRQVEIPATLNALNARRYIDRLSYRSASRGDTLSWRMAQLATDLVPGTLVRAADRPGTWRVEDWEWRSGGTELTLRRAMAEAISIDSADSGAAWNPPDIGLAQTVLKVFELPPETPELRGQRLFAAVSATEGKWSGAALHAVQGDDLVPLNIAVQERTVMGHLSSTLEASSCVVFEPDSAVNVELLTGDMQLASATLNGIANGANRILIGSEILQFAIAEPMGPKAWRLTGLLRGRGGTEHNASEAHPAGTPVVLIDDRLIEMSSDANAAEGYAALGIGDDDAIMAAVGNAGLSRRPLAPVHARAFDLGDGGVLLRWQRRALGAWEWRGLTDAPLVEPVERYEVGVGEPDAPQWREETSSPSYLLTTSTLASLTQQHPGLSVWVRQVGTGGASETAEIFKL